MSSMPRLSFSLAGKMTISDGQVFSGSRSK